MIGANLKTFAIHQLNDGFRNWLTHGTISINISTPSHTTPSFDNFLFPFVPASVSFLIHVEMKYVSVNISSYETASAWRMMDAVMRSMDHAAAA